ncbi:MAG TPA: cupredoxin domain-containing protein [Frankiaceae bacterium]|nr:cupredoxin domain-containing protein [Frankiaceae bacterium]
MTRRFATLLLLLAGFVSVPLPADAATATVTIGSSLSPKSLTVAPGTTVTWRNSHSERHRIRTTSAPVEIDSDDLEPGESYSITLRTAGTYRYVDHREEDDSNYWGIVTVSSSGGGSGGGGTGGGGGGTGGGGTTAPASGTVTMAGRAFSPSSISVRVGGTITFSNNDDDEHTVTANDRSFDSGVLNAGGRYTRTFRTAGTFRYFCAIHTDMTGTVTVPSASGAVPPPAPAAPRPPAAAPAPPPAPPVRVAGKPAAVRVNVIDFGYTPARATARVGDTVSWVNVGAAPHTVTPSGGAPFGTSMLAAGATYRWSPTKTGTWSYVCAFHPQMTGTLVVLPKSAAAPRNAPAGAPAPAVRTSRSPTAAASSPVVAAPGSGTPSPGAARSRSMEPVSASSPLVAWSLWGALGLVTFLALAWWRGREVAGDAAPRG